MPMSETQRKIKRTRIALWIVIAIAVALSAFLYVKNLPPPNGKYDAFAQCIANTSTTFYGAAWCDNCLNQKNEFGDAAKYLPYVECSLNPGQEYPVCVDAGVTHYPTWHFPDGSVLVGTQSLQTLSEKTGCPLPTSS
jgi:hypothetical protein